MHTSISLNLGCEFLDISPVNPLISKCRIKVCYVGENPNRNGSIITKEVAAKMANSLPGSPIVGYYCDNNKDYEEHNKTIKISGGEISVADETKPYGFVDLNAKVWFEKFLDDGKNEREYLVTEGWLWTGQFPECQRIIERGNNQSMELDEKNLNAEWTKDNNNNPQFFIINDAIISKLCILGEKYEPCFEGASIESANTYGLRDVKEYIQSIIIEMKENKGGGEEMSENEIVKTELVEEELEFKKKPEDEEEKKTPAQENTDSENPQKKEDKEEKSDNSDSDNTTEDDKEEKPSESKDKESEETDSKDEDEEEKKKYSLEEIPEYQELLNKYNLLQTDFEKLSSEKADMEKEMSSLINFRKDTERKEKQEMIQSFYMLSDEDKKDVIQNIDTYSLDDIEAKLSVICVRNKVSFTAAEEEKDPMTYSFNGNTEFNDGMPAWARAVLETQKNLNN